MSIPIDIEKVFLLIMLQEGWFTGKMCSGVESSSSRNIINAAIQTNFCKQERVAQLHPLRGTAYKYYTPHIES